MTSYVKINLLFLLFFVFSTSCCFGESKKLQKWFLPKDHPISADLKDLFQDPAMFDNIESLEKKGFISVIQPENIRPWTILAFTHPTINKYIVKKYSNDVKPAKQLENYLARLKGAKVISDYIRKHHLKKIVVPKKWLYRLPEKFRHSATVDMDYLLIVDRLEICPGGYWGGENLEKYRRMTRSTMIELCTILHAIGGCDAWPQNQPFTYSNKIAFIDTEHVGYSPGDFIQNIVPYINPALRSDAELLWNQLVRCTLTR